MPGNYIYRYTACLRRQFVVAEAILPSIAFDPNFSLTPPWSGVKREAPPS